MPRKFNNFFNSALVLCLGIFSAAHAINFRETNLENGKALNPIKLSSIIDTSELHGDMTLTQLWIPGVAGSSSANYNGLLDFRLEHHLSLYNTGKQQGNIVTRIAGVGYIDQRINSFLDDPIIELPELFYQNCSKIGKNNLDLVFGKFVNRRFYGKDEIFNDPYDIGEMRFIGAQVNTLNIMSGINEARDSDLANIGVAGARLIPSGSYGFHTAIKNQDMSGGFFKRWGYEQAFAVARLDDFAGNFYGISEINKDWGKEKSSRAMIGLLYANDAVFRIPNNSNNNNLLIYTGYFSRPWKKFAYHMRYGTLFREIQGSQVPLNEYRIGVNYKITDKDSFSTWLGLFDGNLGLGENDHLLTWVSVFKHMINDHLSVTAAMAQRFDQFSSVATGSQDNNFTLFLHMQTVF